MFTGIITDLGRVTLMEDRGDMRIRIKTAYDTPSISIGASVACSGVCLTVVEKFDDELAFDVSKETLSRSNLGDWRVGTLVNMERSLKVGDELGGHIVTGHVDAVTPITSIVDEGASKRFTFAMPERFTYMIAEKGSVSVNGVSLTVNTVSDADFSVNLVPHTQEMTSFHACKVGDMVNIEIDVLARYLARMNEGK